MNSLGGRITALVLVAGTLGACTDDRDETGEPVRWPRASGPALPTSGLVWASGTTVHLPDGSTIDTKQPVGSYVLAGDAVWFVPDLPDQANGDYADPRLWRATRDGAAATDAYADQLAASPDGRYVVFLDGDSGDDDPDDEDRPRVTLVVVDVTTGEETVRSNRWMADPGGDVYEEKFPTLQALTDEMVYLQTDSDYIAVDLETGDAGEVDSGEVPSNAGSTVWNDDHTWAIEHHSRLGRDAFVSGDGRAVTPHTGSSRWRLFRWINGSTAVGIVVDGPGDADEMYDDGDLATLMTCEVPSGACTRVRGSQEPYRAGSSVQLPSVLPS